MELDIKISDLYSDFNKKILSIVKENRKATRSYFKTRKKLRDKQESFEENYGNKITETTFTIPRDLMEEFESLLDEADEVNLGMFLSSNANFIYLLALYETFLNSLIKLLIENHPPTRKDYMKYFLSRAKDEEKNGNSKLIDMILTPKKCIENLDELQPLMSVLNYLVGHNKTDELYQNNYSNYLEARERRNLFVHRGNILDTKYEKSFKQLLGINNLNKYFDPIMKVVKHNAYDLPERWMGGKKDCSHKASKNDPTRCAVCTAIYGIEPGFDLRVGPGYIMHVYNSLFFLSSVIYRQTLANISNKKSYVQNTDIFNGVLHDHMVYGLNSDLSLGLTYGPPLEIVSYCDTSVSNEHDDITIVNHILCLNELYIHHNAIVSDDADSDPKIDLMEQIVRELEKINNKDKKSIVQSYIDQDFTKYLEKASKMSDKSSFQSWFMTQKFLKNKKFKVAFNKLN